VYFAIHLMIFISAAVIPFLFLYCPLINTELLNITNILKVEI